MEHSCMHRMDQRTEHEAQFECYQDDSGHRPTDSHEQLKNKLISCHYSCHYAIYYAIFVILAKLLLSSINYQFINAPEIASCQYSSNNEVCDNVYLVFKCILSIVTVMVNPNYR